jgi:hypothetical protein
MTAVQCQRIVRNGRLELGAVVAAFLAMAACARGQSSTESHPPASRNRSAAVNDSAEVSRFAQGFLDWYVPIARRDESVPTYWHVLRDRSEFLDEPLARALRDDSTAQRAKPVSRELLGFEPFLVAQDPCDRYGPGTIRREEAAYEVTIQPICSVPAARQWQTHRPVLVVVRDSAGWKIANVKYGKGEVTSEKQDLKTLLCASAKTDSRPERRPAKCW